MIIRSEAPHEIVPQYSCFDCPCYRHRSTDVWLNGPVIQRRMFLRTQTANRTSLRQRREPPMANRIFQVFGNSAAGGHGGAGGPWSRTPARLPCGRRDALIARFSDRIQRPLFG